MRLFKLNCATRGALHCTPLLECCQLLSHLREPLLVVDVGNEAAV